MFRSTSFVTIALALVACSDGKKSSIAIDDFVDALRSAECDFEVRCEAVPDEATCIEASPLSSTTLITTIADAKSGLITYDEKAAAACVNVFAGLGCTFSDITAPVEICNSVFAGTVATNGACVVDGECADHGNCVATDQSCDSATACCAGTCAVNMTSQSPIGGPCSDSECVDGAYCSHPATGAPVCAAQVSSEGGACDAFDACKAPLQCDLGIGTGTGTCKSLPAEGEACETSSLFACNDLRDYCDPTAKVCTHRVDVGADCTNASCAGFAGCDQTTKKCVARPSLGDACDDSSAGNCLGSLDCVDGTCSAGPAGMDCSGS